jgi:hypothetical protein
MWQREFGKNSLLSRVIRLETGEDRRVFEESAGIL